MKLLAQAALIATLGGMLAGYLSGKYPLQSAHPPTELKCCAVPIKAELDVYEKAKVLELGGDLADPNSARVRAIVEICGTENDGCVLNFWSASDDELDDALQEYRAISGGDDL